MPTSTKNHHAVIEALAALRTLPNYVTLFPREFVSADLNWLAVDGIFPEEDMLFLFQSRIEEKIFPIFGDDRGAFDEQIKMNVEISSGAFEQMIASHRFDALGIGNISFFVYCVSMIIRNGVGGNPYFGLTYAEENFLKWVFRHLVEDGEIPTVGSGRIEPSVLSFAEMHVRLCNRGIITSDGALNRNAMKNAIVELGWIYRSDFCIDLADKLERFDSLTTDERKSYGESYLTHYLTLLLLRYLGSSLASDDWFLDRAFPILEDFLSLCELQKKQSRHDLRVNFTGFVTQASRETGLPAKDLLFKMGCSMSELKQFGESIGAKTMLDMLYGGSLIAEFAQDVSPLMAN